MANKMELKKAANLLKAAGIKERDSIDWDMTGIEYFQWENMSEKIEACKAKRKKLEAEKAKKENK